MFSKTMNTVRDIIGIAHFMGIGLYVIPLFVQLFHFELWYCGYYIPFTLYTLWYVYDMKTPERSGRPYPFFRNTLVWRCLRDYLPVTLVKTAELPADRNYIIGCHPHGLFPFGGLINFSADVTGFSQLFPGVTSWVAIFPLLFLFPYLREYLLASHCISVSKRSLKFVLTKCGKGNSVCIIVGGSRELLETCPGSTVTVLKNRKGFVRTALETGSDLVPVYNFGENDLFWQLHHVDGWEWLKRLQLKLIKLFGFPLPLPTSPIPKRRPLFTVVGRPISVEKCEHSSTEQVDQLHQKYMTSLEELFEENKLKCGYEQHQKLEFI